MKVPDSLKVQFMIASGSFSNVAQFEKVLQKLLDKAGLDTQWSGRQDNRILWVMPKNETPLPKAPQGTPIKNA